MKIADLGHLLDDYMKPFEKVKILRLKKREGLIRASLNGAKIAQGQILVFLDSHCEVFEGLYRNFFFFSFLINVINVCRLARTTYRSNR